jgi:hypothetical protein
MVFVGFGSLNMANERLDRAIALIDAANGQDPNLEEDSEGAFHPKELLYSRRMTAWLERLEPEASDALKIAARAQHIRRWTIPRDGYPRTRVGYLQWRTELYRFHGEETATLMARAGYDPETIDRVKKMLAKRGLKRNLEVQLIEDVACLVFLEHYFSDFSKDHDEDKVIDIVRKTWSKMSERGQKAAFGLDLSEPVLAFIRKAI